MTLASDMAVLPVSRPSQERKLPLTVSVSAGARAGNCQIVRPSLKESSLALASTKESRTSTILATMVGALRPQLLAMDAVADCKKTQRWAFFWLAYSCQKS